MNRSLLATVLLVLVAFPAHATQSPPGCDRDGVALDIRKSATAVANGDTVTFTVIVGNVTAPGVCDASNVTVTAFCPDASGQPTKVVKIFPLITDLKVGTALFDVGAFVCTIDLAPGQPTAIARSTLTGILHDNPIHDDVLAISKDLSILVAQGPPSPPAIPTLSELGLTMLAVVLALGGVVLRRHTRS
jgi:uncharacterized repeat protein (TIGR01451 family)